ncbi:MAG: IdeS/Mac family cysteine endopeptidase [Opitutales bacterium]|nr:IdeS/Mac family cysteine endopeptidase [Opitutales bacterium]
MFTARLLVFVALSGSFSAVSVFGGTGGSAWAPGVSMEKGWIDVNKAHVPYSWEDAVAVGGGNDLSMTDKSMCWAAQSANMLQYWQNMYVASGRTLATGTPDGFVVGRETATRRQYQIFEHFVSNWTDMGGSSTYGIPWYLCGGFFSDYPTGVLWSECFGGMDKGGFFTDIYPTAGDLNWVDFRSFTYTHQNTEQSFTDVKGFSDVLIGCFKNLNAVVGLNVYLKNNSTSGEVKHALTVWGCDYDAAGMITKIYLTDSDDGEVGLKTVSVQSGSDGKLYLSGYSETETARIQDFSMLSVNKFLVSVPEPSAFGLLAGLAGIFFAGTRRRHRS